MQELTRSSYLYRLYVAASTLIDIGESASPLYAALNTARTDLLFLREPAGLDTLLQQAETRISQVRSGSLVLA